MADFTPSASLGSSEAEWRQHFFTGGGTYTPTSAKQYWDTVSYGTITMQAAAETYGTSGNGIVFVTLGYAHPNPSATGDVNRQITRDALIASDSFVNFASFDDDSDGYLNTNELHVYIVVRGYEEAFGGASVCTDKGKVWAHKWSLGWGAVGAPVLDGVVVGHFRGAPTSGPYEGGYMQTGEWHCSTGHTPGHIATIGLTAHELGHDMGTGVPDLYDTDLSSKGIGNWGLQGYGNWNGSGISGHAGTHPAFPDPWSRWFLGFLTPTQITSLQAVSLPQVETATANNRGVFQFGPNPGGVDWGTPGTGEYFLVENRQQVGFDAGLPGNGLLIWHIDESAANNADEGTSPPGNPRIVVVEQADGQFDLECYTGCNAGDTTDPWRVGTATSFTDTSTPNSKHYDGSSSGVGITNISASGTTMTATLDGPVGGGAPPNDDFANATIVNSNPYTNTVDTTNATTEAGDPDPGCDGPSSRSKSVWYQFTPVGSGTVTVNTFGSNYDTVLSAWSGSPGLFSQEGCNDDANGTLQSQMSLSVAPDITYYFMIIAFDAFGNSPGGTLVFNFDLNSGDTTPPVISGVASSNITSSGATITWTTNEPSTSQVEYGTTTTPYAFASSMDRTLVTSHSVNLSGLTPDTLYHYRVRSLDAAGNLGLSGDFTFTTAPPVTLAIERVSVDSNGVEANGPSEQPSVSADGRSVAFASSASNLTAVDTQGVKNIFLRDRQTGETLLVRPGSGGVPANADCWWPAISADGSHIAFTSSATNLVVENTNGFENVYVVVHPLIGILADRLVSRGFDGSPADGDSCCPSISADSRFVAFYSEATNLIAGDTNGVADIFVHERQTGATTRVSVSSNGAEGNGNSWYPVISADGRFVAFASRATNLVASDTNGVDDIFVHDLQTRETTRVSVSSNGVEASGRSGTGNNAISADGRFVAFDSLADNLVIGDTNSAYDTFVHDRQTSQTERVSVASDGTQGNNFSGWPAVSADGRFVSFISLSSSLVSSVDGGGHIFLRDRQTGQTTLAALARLANQGEQFIVKQDISADGRFVSFTSGESDLVAGDNNGVTDVFVAATGLVGAPVAVTAELSDGNVGTAYSQTLRAIGGTPPYTWAVLTGSLPVGLGFDLSTGEISGTPTAVGIFDFTVQVSDSANPSQTGTRALSITVISLPTVSSQSVTTAEETSITITLTGIDPENDPLTFSIVTDPTHGTLSPITPVSDTSAEVTYTPNTDFNGSDSFSFKVNDGALDSNPATVSITVNAVNDAPVAQDDAFNLEEDSTLNVAAAGVLANDTDVDGDSLTAILASGPTNGSLTLNSDGSFSYVPSPDFNGTDSFTYKANDGTIDSNTATVSITVTPVNDAPVANAGADQTVAGTSDNGASVTLDGSASSDFENDPLTYTWTGPFPEGGGTVTGLNPTVTLNFGTSTITLVVNDGQGDSAPDTLDITITDFTVGTSPSSVTVTRGQSAGYTVTLSPQFASFDATVSLSCSNLPSLSSCSFSPATLTPGGNDATSTLTVSTTAPSAFLTPPFGPRDDPPFYAFWLGLPGLAVVGLALMGQKPRKVKPGFYLSLGLLFALLVLQVACGGGGATTSSQPPPRPGTPTGTFNITITGTAGSLQRTAPATLTVQ